MYGRHAESIIVKLKRPILVNLVLSFVSITLFFLGIEFFLSMTNIYNNKKYFLEFENIHPDFNSFLRDGLLFWKFSPNHSGITTQGFRDLKVFSIHKPKDVFRVICIGDSVPFGYNTTTVKTEETYPKVLEKLLKERVDDKIEVINAGVPGYSSLQGLRYLKRDLLQYNPDLIIVHFGINDGAAAVYLSDKEQPIFPNWLIGLQNILNKSRTYQFLNKIIFYFKYRHKKHSYRARVDQMDYMKNIQAFAGVAKKNGFKAIFITPVLYEKNKINIGLILPKDIICVNLSKIFKEKENKAEELFLDNCHLTVKGHQIVAEIIYTFLIK